MIVSGRVRLYALPPRAAAIKEEKRKSGYVTY